MSRKVLVCGCGNLGRWHIVGLGKSEHDITVYAVDASDNALKSLDELIGSYLSGFSNRIRSDAGDLAEELWHQLGGSSSVHRAGWPVLDPSALVQDSVDLVIQIKGKVRGTIQVPAAADKEQLEALALASEVAAKWLEGQPPRRVIVVPGKLVNLVP